MTCLACHHQTQNVKPFYVCPHCGRRYRVWSKGVYLVSITPAAIRRLHRTLYYGRAA